MIAQAPSLGEREEVIHCYFLDCLGHSYDDIAEQLRLEYGRDFHPALLRQWKRRSFSAIAQKLRVCLDPLPVETEPINTVQLLGSSGARRNPRQYSVRSARLLAQLPGSEKFRVQDGGFGGRGQ